MSEITYQGLSGARRDLPPLHYRLPTVMSAPSHHRKRRSTAGALLGLAMYAMALWLAVANDTFRHYEAVVITPVTAFVTGRHGAVTSHTLVYFALGTHRAFGLQVTNECTSALLLIPLLVMMGSFAIFTRIALGRQLVAVAAGAALILLVNVIRVAGIAWATWKYGFNPGYTYSHIFVGSAFSLIGFVGAMLAALWILVRTERLKRGVRISRAWWVARAPATHRAKGANGGAAYVDALIPPVREATTRPRHRFRRRR